MPPSSVGDLSLELLRLSLSQRQAKRRLIDGVAERLQLERRPLILGELLFRLLEPDTAAAAALGVLLLVVAVTGLALPWDGLLGGLLLALAVANAWISSRESRLAAGELKSRLQVWLRLISRDHHIHRAAADGPATVALMRDGVWLRLHRNLCVEGDLIKLSAGEEAPGACAQRPHLTSLCGLEAQALEAGAPFFPAPLPPLPRGVSSSLTDDVRCSFVLSETIAVRQIDGAMRSRRKPPPPLQVQLAGARRLMLWAVAGSWAQAAALQALGYGLSSPPPSPSGEQGFELREWLGGFLLPHLAALALPLLPLALPAFIAAANALCAAYLLASLSGMPLHSLRPASPRASRQRRADGWGASKADAALPRLGGWGGGGGSWLGRSAARRYWGLSGGTPSHAESEGAASSACRIARRGPERLFSHGAPNTLPGSRFVRHAGSRQSYEQWLYVLQLALRILRGEPQPGQVRPSRLLASLGSVTVLAVPDKRGVLSDGTLSIKQLAFFRLDHSGQPKLTTLDMSKHPAYRFLTRFDDPGWRGHLAALKPIGLNAVLNSMCRHSDGGAAVGDTLRSRLLHSHHPSHPLSSELRPPPGERWPSAARLEAPLHPCLCLLARAIGFSDDVLRRYSRRAEIHLVGSPAPPAEAAVAPGLWAAGSAPQGRAGREAGFQLPLLVAVVVEDEGGSLQVFSRGPPGMVLSRCSSLWDGDSIRPLEEEERRQLLGCNASMAGNRCLECFAFSYSPVPEELKWLFSGDESLQTIVLHDSPAEPQPRSSRDRAGLYAGGGCRASEPAAAPPESITPSQL